MIEVIIGGIIALLGSILTQILLNIHQRKQKENDVLFEINKIMLDLSPEVHDVKKKDMKIQEINRLEIIKNLERISNLSLKLQSKSNRSIAVSLTIISLDFALVPIQFFDETLKQLHFKINNKMIRAYENTIKGMKSFK